MQLVNFVLNTEPKSSKEKKIVWNHDVFQFTFYYIFVVLIIKCVSLPNYQFVVVYIFATEVHLFFLYILFLIFTNCFQEGLKSFFISDADKFDLILWGSRVFKCKKCVCAYSSSVVSDKLFPKLNFQSFLDLLLTNPIFLSLLFFCLAMENVKAKLRLENFIKQSHP